MAGAALDAFFDYQGSRAWPGMKGRPAALYRSFTYGTIALFLTDVRSGIPEGIEKEFREAERCLAFGAWRAASALIRSTLEKTLNANGYRSGTLAAKIDTACADGVITDSRRKRAHEEVRVLGNDVLHDEWHPVAPDDVGAARHYAQRIIEDLYDDRPSVEAILRAKKRVP